LALLITADYTERLIKRNQNEITMNQNVSTFSAGMRYGLLGGVISIIIGLIMYLSGMVDYSTGKQDIVSQVLGYAVMIGAVILALKFYKDNNGHLSIGQGLGTSFFTGLFMGLLTAIWIYVFFSFIDPSLLDIIKEAAKENAMAGGQMSEEQYEQAEGMMNAFMSPGMMSVFGMLGTIFATFIVGLIASLIMKQDPNPLANTFKA